MDATTALFDTTMIYLKAQDAFKDVIRKYLNNELGAEKVFRADGTVLIPSHDVCVARKQLIDIDIPEMLSELAFELDYGEPAPRKHRAEVVLACVSDHITDAKALGEEGSRSHPRRRRSSKKFSPARSALDAIDRIGDQIASAEEEYTRKPRLRLRRARVGEAVLPADWRSTGKSEDL